VRTGALSAEPLSVARGLIGTPYVWGGLGRDGIDCSGLVHLAFRAVGVRVPRDAADQAAAAVPVERPEAGDLWFFGRPDEPVSHVGFVTETGLLHADPNRGVVEEPMPEERRATLVGARRLQQ
jgi:cell wall-associated NlpC family hydrolase